MMSSIYSGVSGLKAQQKKLDVIGNNIANVNTAGFKGSTVSFSDLLSQTLSGASAGNGTTGGTNAKQIGLGVSVAATTTSMTTGSTQSTGNSSDVSISGSGFFIVEGASTSQYQFTRAGNFGVDSAGNLVVNGYNVCGWPDSTVDADGNYNFDTEVAVEPINLFADGKKTLAPKVSGESTLSGSLDASADIQSVTTTTATTGSMAIAAANATGLTNTSASATSFAGTITINGTDITINTSDTIVDVLDSINAQTATTGVAASFNTGDASNGYIQLTSSSAITLAGANTTLQDLFAATSGTDTSITASTTSNTSTAGLTADSSTTLTVYDALGNSYNVQVKFYKTAAASGETTWYWEASTTDTNLTVSGSDTIEFDSSGKIKTLATTPSILLTPTNFNAGADAFTVNLDMDDLTSYANSGSDSLTNTTDGYSSGDLSDFSIGSDGTITGIYSNGQTQPLAMLALANFTNPSGLLKIGNNLYSTTVNSGEFTGGVTAGSAGTGSLSAGTLEMSNVDLSEQFSEMMITQRAYQANSKIVSAADECLQAVINMVN